MERGERGRERDPRVLPSRASDDSGREKLVACYVVLRDEVGRICPGTIVSRAPIIGPTLGWPGFGGLGLGAMVFSIYSLGV